MVLVRERISTPLHQTRECGLVGLAPYLREFVSNQSTVVYIPGKRYSTQDEVEVYGIARNLGLPAYSMCLEELDGENSITGDFTHFDFRQVSPYPLVVLNGVFCAWSGELSDGPTLRGTRNLRGIMSTSDLALLLYVEQDMARFAPGDSLRNALIEKFIAQSVRGIDDIDVVNFRMQDSRHLLFYRNRASNRF